MRSTRSLASTGSPATDGLRRGERERAGEDREAGQHACCGSAQQVVRPVERRPQRPMTFDARPPAPGQQAEHVVEAIGDLGRAQRARPGRGELDGQRDAVEAAADPRDGLASRGGSRRRRPPRPGAENSSTAGPSSSTSATGSVAFARLRRRAAPETWRASGRSGSDDTMRLVASAAASRRCSQLSRISRAWRNRRPSISESEITFGARLDPERAQQRSAPSPPAGRRCRAGRTRRRHGGWAWSLRPTSSANRVLPIPPTPVRVTTLATREVVDQRLDVGGPPEQHPGSGRQVAGAHAARSRRAPVALERRILQPVEPHRLDHVAELVDSEVDERRRRTELLTDDLAGRRAEQDLCPVCRIHHPAARFTAGPK